MQILVRPLVNGAYYKPGDGADSVIADIGGKPVQARRKLIDERDAERDLIAKCPVLERGGAGSRRMAAGPTGPVPATAGGIAGTGPGQHRHRMAGRRELPRHQQGRRASCASPSRATRTGLPPAANCKSTRAR
jgi:hypothetical protein